MADLEPADYGVYGIPRQGSSMLSAEMRQALEALARNFYTTDDTKPLDVRTGQLRVNAADPTNEKLELYSGGDWRTLIQYASAGVPAPAKQVVSFPAASDAWVVQHDLSNYAVAVVLDSSFRQFRVVNTFDHVNVPLASVDVSLAVGPVLFGYPVEFNGVFLNFFGVVEKVAVTAGGGISAAMFVDKTPGGGALTPVVGGALSISGPASIGDVIVGAGATADNDFSYDDGDLLRVVTSGTPTVAGQVQIWGQMQRALNAGECRVTQVSENQLSIDHASPVTGYVVLVG